MRVSGRPIHAKAMLIPTKSYGKDGFEYVVPLVTDEDDEWENQSGYLLSKGFMPSEFKYPAQRYRLESADKQTFECFVGKLEELQ